MNFLSLIIILGGERAPAGHALRLRIAGQKTAPLRRPLVYGGSLHNESCILGRRTAAIGAEFGEMIRGFSQDRFLAR